MDRVQVQWSGSTRTFDGPRVVIGRELDCDVPVTDARASRHHAFLEREHGAWVVIDASSNGTFVAGQRITRVPLGGAPVSLNLGGPAGESVVVSLVPVAHGRPALAPQPAQPVPPAAAAGSPQPPAPQATPAPQVPQAPPAPEQSGEFWRNLPPPQLPASGAPVDAWRPVGVLPPGQLPHGHSVVLPQHLLSGRPLTIGREATNDIVLDDPLVSRQHARLDPPTATTAAVLHDLGSFNGTFVNGHRVVGAVQLVVGTEVIFGNQTFRWDGQQLVASATAHEFTLYADGLTQVVAGGKRLIENISFKLEPRSLTAVIGPSGAGKSTLLGALTGLKPASHGRVIWQGHDLYQHYDQLRFQIGLVPQQDILHPQLKVRQGLKYAAQLRLPPDTGAAERDGRVDQVARQLQLVERMDNRIGTQLSGGQRKRVSIATELLTAPPLLFLDEPTSGLDPGLDLEVMKQLRTLADDGRVVMVVTHSVLALDVCDNVLVLAPGGKIAYFGPPSDVLAHFGRSSYPEVFDLLDEPDLWRRIPAPQHTVDTSSVPAQSHASQVPAPPRQSATRQLSTLVQRNLAVVLADRLLLGMLVMLPLILGGLSRLVPGSDGLSVADALASGEGAAEPQQRLTVLIVAACLMGTALAVRELVGERPIFQREYAVGLSPGLYFLSKVLVLGAAAFVQGLVVTFLATVGLPGADGELGTLRVAIAIAALSFTMVVLGLALSALVTSTEQTMPALVGVVMVQLVLSGALFQIAGRVVLEQIAWLSPSRWSYAASASAMDLGQVTKGTDDEDWIALAGAGHYLMDLMVLALLCLFTLGLGLFLTRRSATGDA
ncbi:ATP-binding cassette domain-containing protein [Nocardioides sp. zg-536]|uniref:ATP-binding cassette domain-containing protein n=1 Tax=Nocardioides faecalis TaxID=2803858 RepID=A0A939BSG6_9ACTN|nr:FHA domain-containing protein [Nocardioides faecalis]MBM9459609.1 ATP-binding cassette domain-containing protein [Nocardioides faecalis]QVI58135.1 ATP-binding cassette domain-containing protein [Nocardioides faecalis]